MSYNSNHHGQNTRILLFYYFSSITITLSRTNFQEFNNSEFVFPLVLNNQDLNYCKSDTPEKAIHRYDKHVVGQICEHYGIENPKINCEIYFSDEEIKKVDFLFEENKLNTKFVVIEPQSNEEYSINKVYPFQKWPQQYTATW